MEHLSTLSNKNTIIVFQLNLENTCWPRSSDALYSRLLGMLALVTPHIYRLCSKGFSKIKVYQGMSAAHLDQWPWIGCPRNITSFIDMEQEEFRTVIRRLGYLKTMKWGIYTDTWVRGWNR